MCCRAVLRDLKMPASQLPASHMIIANVKRTVVIISTSACHESATSYAVLSQQTAEELSLQVRLCYGLASEHDSSASLAGL